ncbi:hypothetical protein IWQ47_003933 [Aquimarina sp. EL_43]|uniref:hypothetical protein n=1 Tax=Aquimarina TaxID=290174 RepID=UPI0004B0DFF5|nr:MULTISPECIES: hypothetical protein [Aquimarina]MBG6132042.1 hypothetical protein [Aquimarina sp. EL_35]MBG6152839.1 hypothetical protein [Aquimarina sp. EL_32]MBG6170846.1 hypothetical protein [Aquimarina sp. EL_43]
MYTKILITKGVKKLSKTDQSTIKGAHFGGCRPGGGYTGQSCNTSDQCRPFEPGFPVFCSHGCCYGAF